MFLRILYFILLFKAVDPVNASGEYPQPFFKHYTTNDGLPSSQVYEAIQDADGFMWFATDRGVVKYNGYEFQTFGTKNGLLDNVVFRLFQDNKKRIWMLTFSGRIFIYDSGIIIPYAYNNKIKDLIKGGFQNSIYVDSTENVYIGSTFGLYLINSKGKLTQRFKFPQTGKNPMIVIDELIAGRPVDGFGSGLEIGQNVDLLHMCKEGFYIYKYKNKSFGRLVTYKLKSNRLIFSSGNSILEMKNKTSRIIVELPYSIVNLYEDSENNIWACTLKGLYQLSNSENPVIVKSYLNGIYVSNIKRDKEGGYWITTINDGIYYLVNNNIQNFTFDSTQLKPEVLTQDKTHIYAGYSPSAISKANTNEIKFYDNVFKSEYITSLFFDTTNSALYVGNTTFGYFKNDIFFKLKKSRLNIANIGFAKNNSGLYSGCYRTFIRVLNDSLEELTKIETKLNCVFANGNDRLLVGCIDGAFLYDEKNKTFYPFCDELKGVRVDDIDSYNGNLCFATVGKGIVILSKDNSIKIIDESAGLCSNTIRKIAISKNRIWCASYNGISEIEIIDLSKSIFRIKNIRINEGLIDNEINDIAVLNDTVWVASKEGLSFFSAGSNFTNYSNPIVHFTNFQVNNIDTTIRDNYVFPYKKNTFSVGFESPMFKSLSKQVYSYVLTNDQDSIHGFTTNRNVDFLSLDPGNYSLSIKAMNNSGIWSTKGAKLNFTILAPWWKTNLFRFSILILIVLASFLVYKRRILLLQEKFENEKKHASLQLTAMRAQMNPHFIFNVMSSIRNYMQENDLTSAEKYLTSFAKLVRYTLDNSSIQEVSLEEELQALRNYATLEMQRFENGFDFEIIMDSEIDADEIMVPSLLLQPFVENAIKHGIDKLTGKGKILIVIHKKDNFFLIAIEDNGIGRADSASWNAENRGKHTSFGSRLTFERITAYNKAYNKQINAKIIDLIDDNKMSIGTRVEIEIS